MRTVGTVGAVDGVGSAAGGIADVGVDATGSALTVGALGVFGAGVWATVAVVIVAQLTTVKIAHAVRAVRKDRSVIASFKKLLTQ